MSKPRNSERLAWSQERQADAITAAENGHGWEYLANRWQCSKPNALQWCAANLPAPVCRQIGANGMLLRQPNKGRQYHHAKPPMQAKPFTAVPRPETCQRVWYAHGQLHQCLKPTRNGADRCAECKQHHLTLFDRPAPETPKPKKHSWREPMLRRSA